MGPTAQALTGLTTWSACPAAPPAGWSFSYLDHVGGYLGAVAVLAGLHHRRRTGEGQHVDVSQLEPATVLERRRCCSTPRVNGRRTRAAPTSRPATGAAARRRVHTPRAGRRSLGRHLVHAPTSTGAPSSPRWARRPGRTTNASRPSTVDVAHADELDVLVAAWTASRPLRRRCTGSRQRGVPAGAVQDAGDRLERDPQLAERGHFTELSHARGGEPAARGRAVPDVGDAA